MGGHGALTIYLTSQPLFKSVSAFAPIVNPSSVPWGIKAFTGYLGEDKSQWLKYDATEIVKSLDGAKGKALDVLIDQGSKDSFMPVQLQPEKFEEAVKAKGGKCELRIQVRWVFQKRGATHHVLRALICSSLLKPNSPTMTIATGSLRRLSTTTSSLLTTGFPSFN